MAWPTSPVLLSAPPEPRRSGRPPGVGRWAAVGFVASSGAAAMLCAAVVQGAPLPQSGWDILVRLAAWSGVWALAVVTVFRLEPRIAVPAVLAAAVVLRLVALSGPPTLSDDLYRYAWDGRVQAAGIDPYRHQPTSEALSDLREPWLWPDQTDCAAIGRSPGCTLINRPAERTIYPPVAQKWFALVYGLGGIEARHKPWQVAALGVDLAVIGLILLALRASGRDRRWVALYALCPFPVVELVNNGHVDGLVALFVVAALLALNRQRPFAAGALIGAAAMVKLYPLLLLVALAGLYHHRRTLLPLLWGSAGALVVIVAGYLPHVAAAGWRVLGYLPGYLREEQYDEGGRYLLAGVLGLPVPATAGLAAAGLGAVIGWIVIRRADGPRAFAAVLGGLLLAVTPVQPWYAIPLLAVAAVAAAPVWVMVAAAAYPYFFAVILDVPDRVGVGRLAYGTALVAVAFVALGRRVRRGQEAPPRPPATASLAKGSAGLARWRQCGPSSSTTSSALRRSQAPGSRAARTAPDTASSRVLARTSRVMVTRNVFTGVALGRVGSQPAAYQTSTAGRSSVPPRSCFGR